MFLLSLCWLCIFQALLLLLVANGAPVLMDKLLGNRFIKPIDNGFSLRDGYRLFGNSKTWRGFFSAVFFTTMVAVFWGLEAITGVLFATFTMMGDLLASFIKRRMGNIESSRARGLDTIPESLLPLSLLNAPLGLSLVDIIMIAGLFFLIEEIVSPILYKLHIRNQPY